MTNRHSFLRLLVFAKYPHPGTVKTRLSPPLASDAAALLYRAFLFDALDSYTALGPGVEPVLYLASQDDIPRMREALRAEGAASGTYIHADIDIRPQRGATLGERLTAAFDEAFSDGCAAACAIGTDHPSLPLDHVRTAFAAMSDHDMAIGPADDGGYYLLALRAPHPEVFRDMPYSTPALYAATLAVTAAHGIRVLELPEWYDVDDARSLARLWNDRHMLPPGSRTLKALAALQEEIVGRIVPADGSPVDEHNVDARNVPEQ